jgi:hypothetical protein
VKTHQTRTRALKRESLHDLSATDLERVVGGRRRHRYRH